MISSPHGWTAQLRCFATVAEWLDTLCADWQRLRDEAVSRRGFFSVALAGGSSPILFYRALAQRGLTDSCKWFLGDERTVPLDHPDSNFRMARETLFVPASIPPQEIFAWRTDLTPPEAAADYQQKIISLLGPAAEFDLCLLGIGPDGHTASLFPGTEALDITDRWTASNPVPQLHTTRLTLTFPTLQQARQNWFLLAGRSKQAILDTLQSDGCDLPAIRVRGQNRPHVFYCSE